jgi:uncharacterized membrane protein YhaH (DUF805 family)
MAIDLNKDKNELKYYYSENGATLGPFALPQLLEKIDAETLVYRDGIEWTNAKDVEELRKFFKTNHSQNTTKIDTSNFSDNTLNNVETKKMFAAPFSFKGRIRRTEYGLSFVIYILAYGIIIGLIKASSFFGLAYFPLIWFLWAQGAKRCHDRGNSGWYQIIPFYFFWMLFAEGSKNSNDYGNSPK